MEVLPSGITEQWCEWPGRNGLEGVRARLGALPPREVTRVIGLYTTAAADGDARVDTVKAVIHLMRLSLHGIEGVTENGQPFNLEFAEVDGERLVTLQTLDRLPLALYNAIAEALQRVVGLTDEQRENLVFTAVSPDTLISSVGETSSVAIVETA